LSGGGGELSWANAQVRHQLNLKLSFEAANDDEETSLSLTRSFARAALIVPDPRATLAFKRMDDLSAFVIHEGANQFQSRATTVARFHGPARHLTDLLGFEQLHPQTPCRQKDYNSRYPEIRKLPDSILGIKKLNVGN
jgi:hypothetical protein